MILIDIRDTDYGKVVDVRLDNAMLPFSMPYAEYCELERAGKLNDETAIDSNIRFMSSVRELHTLPAAPQIVDGVSSPEWFYAQKEVNPNNI